MLAYLINLGVVLVAFMLVWDLLIIVTAPIAAIANRAGSRDEHWSNLSIKACSSYLMAAFVAVTTLHFAGLHPHTRIWFAIIGGIVVFFWLAQSSVEKEKEARANFDFQALQQCQYDGLFAFAAVALYVLMLYFPSLTVTPISVNAFRAVLWVAQGPVLGWLIGLWGAWTMLGFITNVGCIVLFLPVMLIYPLISALGCFGSRCIARAKRPKQGSLPKPPGCGTHQE